MFKQTVYLMEVLDYGCYGVFSTRERAEAYECLPGCVGDITEAVIDVPLVSPADANWHLSYYEGEDDIPRH